MVMVSGGGLRSVRPPASIRMVCWFRVALGGGRCVLLSPPLGGGPVMWSCPLGVMIGQGFTFL